MSARGTGTTSTEQIYFAPWSMFCLGQNARFSLVQKLCFYFRVSWDLFHAKSTEAGAADGAQPLPLIQVLSVEHVLVDAARCRDLPLKNSNTRLCLDQSVENGSRAMSHTLHAWTHVWRKNWKPPNQAPQTQKNYFPFGGQVVCPEFE